MRTLDITPEEYARWPEETKVLFDLHLERGTAREWTPAVVAEVLAVRVQCVRPYRMSAVYHLDMDINASAYNLWETSTQAGDRFDPETLKDWARRLQHFNCPLFNVEGYDMLQREVPVHEARPFFRFRANLRDFEQGVEVRHWLEEVELRVSDALVGNEAIVWSAPFDVPDYRRVVRITGIDMGAEPDVPFTSRDLLPKRKASKGVPTHVSMHRPRLDGRRR